jgi:hypothetical protein
MKQAVVTTYNCVTKHGTDERDANGERIGRRLANRPGIFYTIAWGDSVIGSVS